MPYLIDTDWFIDYFDEVPEAVLLVDRLIADGISMSALTYMEAYEGMFRRPDIAAALVRLDVLTEVMPVVPLSMQIARQCALIRENLRSRGRRINSRAIDILNAGTAIEHSYILVTRNVADYQDIPGLQLYRP